MFSKPIFHYQLPPPVIPGSFSLNQNYPNPFNPITTIRVDLPEDGYVSLKVYDIAGKQVKTLLDGFTQKGISVVQFDGTNFASGIYFCKLTAGEFNSSIKLVLLK